MNKPENICKNSKFVFLLRVISSVKVFICITVNVCEKISITEVQLTLLITNKLTVLIKNQLTVPINNQ